MTPQKTISLGNGVQFTPSSKFDVDTIDFIIPEGPRVFLDLNAAWLDYEKPEDLELLSAKLQNYVRHALSSDYRDKFASAIPTIRIRHFSQPTDRVKRFATEVTKQTGFTVEFRELV